LDGDELHQAIASMSYAFGSLSHGDYMNMMSQAFSGNVGLGAIDDFLSSTGFEFPDLEAISNNIARGIVDYMRRNLGSGGLKLDQEVIE
jgi:hypothetical protein